MSASFNRALRKAKRRSRLDRMVMRPIRAPGGAARSGRRRAALDRARRNVVTSGFVDVERKFLDITTAYAVTSLTWATAEDGTAKSISAVAQGDGESERDGRVYHIDSVHVRGMIEMPAVDQITPGDDIVVRVCVVWDQQTNAAQLTATEVMTIGGPEDTQAFRDLKHTSQFRVLYDETFVVVRDNQMNEGAVNLVAIPRAMIPFSFDKKFKKPIKVTCGGTTGVIASINDNSLHVIAVSTNTEVRIGHTSRIRFRG